MAGECPELRNLTERLMIVVPQDKIEPLHLPANYSVAVRACRSSPTPRFTKRATRMKGSLFCASSKKISGT